MGEDDIVKRAFEDEEEFVDASNDGVRVGDLVLMLDNIKVPSAKAFKGIVRNLSPGKAVPLLVQRQGNPIFLALKPQN